MENKFLAIPSWRTDGNKRFRAFGGTPWRRSFPPFGGEAIGCWPGRPMALENTVAFQRRLTGDSRRGWITPPPALLNAWARPALRRLRPRQAITAAFRMAVRGAETARKPPPLWDGSTGQPRRAGACLRPGPRYPARRTTSPSQKQNPGAACSFTCMLYSCLVDAGFSGYRGLLCPGSARELFRLLEKEGPFHPATPYTPAHRQSRRKGDSPYAESCRPSWERGLKPRCGNQRCWWSPSLEGIEGRPEPDCIFNQNSGLFFITG